MIHLVGGIS